ncbi:MAG: histidinol dehydrogenase [Caldilineaceae bacterium]
MSIRILDADEARTTILRRRAWDAWNVPAALLDGIERNFGARLTPDEAVRRILDDIRREGDAALRRWTETLDRVTPAMLAVTPEQIAAAYAAVDAAVIDAMRTAAARSRLFIAASRR